TPSAPYGAAARLPPREATWRRRGWSDRRRGEDRLGLGDGLAVEVALGLAPDQEADVLPGLAGLVVAVVEVDPAVFPGDAGLIGGGGERLPGQGDRLGRDRARLDPGAASRAGLRHPEGVAAGGRLEEHGRGGAEGRVPREVFGERGGDEVGQLVGHVVLTPVGLGGLVRTRPGLGYRRA